MALRFHLLVLVLLGVAFATPSFAHATLITSEPADQSVLFEPPSRLVLTFNEQVAIIGVKLIDATGRSRDLADVHLEGDAVVALLPADIGSGTDVVSFRVISSDGHPVGGSVVFSVGTPSTGVTAPAATDRVVDGAIWIAEMAVFAAFFGGIGGTFFGAWIAVRQVLPHAAARIVRALLLAGLVAAPLSLGLQGLDVLGRGLTQLVDLAVWQAGLGSSYGQTVIVGEAALALALAAGLLRANLRVSRGLATAAFLAVGIALALSGHAATAPPEAATRVAVFLHGLGVTFWVGSLLPLAMLLVSRESGAAGTLARFASAIPFALVPLLAAGLFLSLVQMVGISDLWTTDYGRVLAGKLAAVAVLLAIAAFNRFRLTAAATSGRPGRLALARAIGAEIVMAGLILGLVATWRFTPPPRNLAAAALSQRSAFIHVMNDKVMAEVTIAPGRVGPVRVSIQIADPLLKAIPVKRVTLSLANPAAGIEAISREASAAPDGTWTISSLTIPVSGRWAATVEVLISDFEAVTFETPVDIPG